MNDLQRLALEHVQVIVKEIGSEIIGLGTSLRNNKEEFDEQKHSYPIHGKTSTIDRWIEAILDNTED